MFFLSTFLLLQNAQGAPPANSLWDFLEPIEQSTDRSRQNSVTKSQIPPAERKNVVGKQSEQLLDFYQDPLKSLGKDPLDLSQIDPKDFDIPIDINEDVIRWMKYFHSGSGRRYYKKWLQRSAKYVPMMHQKLEAAGLPKDLIYLSMIESGFATHAYSSAAAVGLWQFISSTGKENGLRIDWWVDARRDPELATDAAIKFLSRLHRVYDGDWRLAWAAYNGGPGRMSRAIKKHKTNDFWTIVKEDGLPAETDNYVPKIMAAAIIGKYSARYGFTNLKYEQPKKFESVEVDANIGLDVLAKCANITQKTFADLNPKYRRWALPPTPEKQIIRVPEKKSFLAALSKIPPQKRLTFRQHKVKKGESLGKIAKKYGCSVKDIQRVNKIKNPNRVKVGMVLVIPTAGSSYKSSESYVSKKSTKKTTKKSTKKSTKKTTKKSTKKRTHTIKKGENLSSIAKKYKVTSSDLMKWNGISNAHKIYAGQKLKLYPSTSKKTTSSKKYTVKKGDSLGKIAKKYGCSVADIKKWNSLRSDRIYPGQKLKIKK